MSLYAVSCFNETFSRAAALSPSLNLGSQELDRLLRRAKMKRDTVIYMDLGETEMKWRGMSRRYRYFCQLLQEKNVLLTSRVVPGGEHCEASWEKQIPFFLPALLYELEG